MTKLLDTKDAAKYLGLSESGLKYYVYRVGKIRPARYFGRSPAYSQESLDEFQENERRRPGRPRKGKERTVDTNDLIRNLEGEYYGIQAANPDWEMTLWDFLISRKVEPDDIWEYSYQIGQDAGQPMPDWL